MTSDDVLKEFGASVWVASSEQAMADRIVELTNRLTAVEAELGALEKQFTSACRIAQDYCRRHDIGTAGDDVFRVMDIDAKRNRSILAALRKPSEAVVRAALEEERKMYDPKVTIREKRQVTCITILRAAVAAAEKEV